MGGSGGQCAPPRAPPSAFPLPDHPPAPPPPASPDLGGALSSAAVVAFVESGRDVLLALSPAATPDMRALAAAFGVDVDPAPSVLLAPSSCAGGDAASVLAPVTGPPPMVGGAAGGPPVLYRGAALTVAPTARQAWPALVAPASAASSAAAPGGPPAAAGGAAALVVGAQTRANARVVVSGSADVFSDAATADAAPCGAPSAPAPVGNAAFASAVLAWAFNEAGSLVAGPLRHSLADPAGVTGVAGVTTRPGDAPYRVGDPLVVALDVAERVPGGGLKPFAPSDDVQVEYTMLDPHVRTFLNPVVKTSFANATNAAAPSPDPRFATLAAAFAAPDVYGVFKFAVHHARPGWSFIDQETVAPVRPFNHNEYDRFLPAAYPYYTAAASVSVAFFVAVGVALYSE